MLDLTKRRFYFAEDNLSCTIHISKYVYEFVLFPHHFLAVQQSAFFFFNVKTVLMHVCMTYF